MSSVHDVAAYIFAKSGEMTAMKLQKLVYYSQAWSLVWDEKSLFKEPVEAWAQGPVVRRLYNQHRGEFLLTGWRFGDPEKLSTVQRETVDAVLGYYGDLSSQQLSDLTHQEEPWIKARVGLAPDERGDAEISHASMAEFYEALASGA